LNLWSYGENLFAITGLDALEAFLGIGLKTQDDSRRGIGSASEAKAIIEVHTNAVDLAGLTAFKFTLCHEFKDELVVFALVHLQS